LYLLFFGHRANARTENPNYGFKPAYERRKTLKNVTAGVAVCAPLLKKVAGVYYELKSYDNKKLGHSNYRKEPAMWMASEEAGKTCFCLTNIV
jgi:hypothetical protein